jgi:hypothetical protein
MMMAPLLAVAVAALGIGAETDDRKRAEALVAQLGHPDFRDREKAAKELLAIGYPAREAVLAGTQSADQEISERCRKLYPAIWRSDLEKRAQKFIDQAGGPVPDDLPGAERWLKIAGDSKASRQQYAEMLKAHPEPLLEVDQNPARLVDVCREHMRAVYARSQIRTVGTPATPATATETYLFLFLGASGDVRPATLVPGTSTTHTYQFLTTRALADKLTDAEAGPPIRKLFAAWLERERYSVLLRRAIEVAAQNKVTECAPVALRIATDTKAPPFVRAMGVIGFARLGTKADIDELRPFLVDTTPIGTVIVNSVQWTAQMRDVALGAAVQLAGENLAEFGFERRPPSGLAMASSYSYFAFPSDEKRDAAHKKWKEWAQQNLKK